MKVKTHKRRKHRKSNPAKSKKTTTRRHRRRHNPAPSTHRRRKTHRRRNPNGDAVGTILQILTGIGSAGVAAYTNNMAAKWMSVKWRGVPALLIGVTAAFLGRRNRYAMTAGITAASVGGLDILRQLVPALAAFSAEDAGYLLGSAAADDPELAAMLGAVNSGIPGIVPNFGFDTSMIPLGAANSRIPGVVPNLGLDTSMIPLGDMEGDGLFSDDLLL